MRFLKTRPTIVGLGLIAFLIVILQGCDPASVEDLRIEKGKVTLDRVRVERDPVLQELISVQFGDIKGRSMHTEHGVLDVAEAMRVDNEPKDLVRYTLALSNHLYKGFANYVVRKNGSSEVFDYLTVFEPDSVWLNEVYDWDYYTGQITLMSLDGNILSRSDLKDGVSINQGNGRSEECYRCTMTTQTISSTGHSYVLVECEDGTTFNIFRAESCGEEDGSSSSEGFSTNSGTDGYTGSTGTKGGSSGNTSTPTNDSKQTVYYDENYDPIGIIVPTATLVTGYLSLERLTASSTLSEQQSNRLNEVYSVMLEACANKRMVQNLRRRGTKLSFKINPRQNNPGGFNPSSNTITFRSTSDIQARVLEEEVFHAYQHYQIGIGKYLQPPYKGRSNIEFEAKLYGDISCLMNGGACAFLGNSSAEYFDWVVDLTDDGKHYPDLSDLTGRYFEFMEKFVVFNSAYDYPIDYNLKPKTMFEAFKGCD